MHSSAFCFASPCLQSKLEKRRTKIIRRILVDIEHPIKPRKGKLYNFSMKMKFSEVSFWFWFWGKQLVNCEALCLRLLWWVIRKFWVEKKGSNNLLETWFLWPLGVWFNALTFESLDTFLRKCEVKWFPGHPRNFQGFELF